MSTRLDTSPTVPLLQQQDEDSTNKQYYQTKPGKRKEVEFFTAIGSALYVIPLLLAILFAIFTGCLGAVSLISAVSMIDEIILYDYRYIRNSSSIDYICNDTIPAVFTLDDSGVAANRFIVDKTNDLMVKLIVLLAAYVGSLIIAQSLWTATLFSLMKKLRLSLFKKLLGKDLSWYDVHPSTESAPLMTDFLIELEEGFEHHSFWLFQYFSLSISCLTVAFIISWKMILAFIIFLMLTLFFCCLILKVSIKRSYSLESYNAKAISMAEELLSSIRTVEAYQGKKFGMKWYSLFIKKLSSSSVKLNFAYAAVVSSIHISATFVGPLTNGLAYLLLMYCDISVQEAVQIVLALTSCLSGMLLGFYELVAVGKAIGSLFVMRNIWASVEEGSVTKRSSTHKFNHTISEGRVQFKKVSFNYPSRPNVTVLSGINFEVEPGQSVALIGPSGSGKSTITKLLLGLYQCDSGLISVDDIDVQYLDVLYLRKQIGLVSQEPVLFNVSIYENIRYGYPEAKQYKIENATKTANIHDFIVSLPNGYDTVVGEGGIKLSGGQKQRIAIARALVRDPKIIILDEATSALDRENERIVQEALDKATMGRTTITIAHRLSTVRKANMIIGIENGSVVEMGTHSELMGRKGLYYRLMMEQQALVPHYFDPQVPVGHSADIISTSTLEAASMSEEKLKKDLTSHQEHKTADQLNELKPSLLTNRLLILLKENSTAFTIILYASILLGLKGTFAMTTNYVFGSELQSLPDIASNKDNKKLLYFTLLFLFVIGMTAITMFLGYVLMFTGGGNLVQNLRYDTLKAMLQQGIPWFDRAENAVGVLITKLTIDPAKIDQIMGFPMGLVFESVFAYGTMVVLFFMGSSSMAVVIVPVAGLVFLSQVLYLAFSWRIVNKLKPLMEACDKIAVESINHITVVKSLGINNLMESLYKKRLLKGERLKLLRTILRVILISMSIPVIFCCHILILWISVDSLLTGGNFVNSNDSTTYLSYMSFFVMVTVFGFTYSAYLTALPSFQDGIVSGSAIVELVYSNDNKETPRKQIKPIGAVTSRIRFCNVGFSYPTRPEIPVLTDVNISIEEGKTLAIVGASGSGKTTIVSLLERFYEPSSGVIRLGEYNLCDLDVSWLRQQISLVSQEPVLFNMSIADNIRYGALHKTVTGHEIMEAAKSAKIHNFIMSLPLGYETIVGLKGVQLSGGQKQRVAIARALIQDPKILLLDEATSSLDTENEKIVQAALNKARINRTTIIIAHRLSTIHDADKIVVIDKGVVIEEGSHLELMKSRGMYYEMNCS